MPRGRLPRPGQEGHAAAAGPHRRVDGSADPPLQDLHRGLQGARGRGRTSAIESPRGEIGCYIVSRRHRPSRTACTSAARRFYNLQTPAAHDARRPRSPTRSPIISSRRPDHGRGRPLMARFTDANVALRPGDHRPLPAAEVGARSRCCTSRRSRTATSPTTRWSTSPSWSASRRPRCSARARFYEMFKLEPVGTLPASTSAPTSPACSIGGDELLEHAEEHARHQGRRHHRRRRCSPSRTSSASPRAPRRPCLQVNYRYRYKVTHDDFDQLIDDLRAGRLDDEIPPHGTLARIRQHIPADRCGRHRPPRPRAECGRPTSDDGRP